MHNLSPQCAREKAISSVPLHICWFVACHFLLAKSKVDSENSLLQLAPPRLATGKLENYLQFLAQFSGFYQLLIPC